MGPITPPRPQCVRCQRAPEAALSLPASGESRGLEAGGGAEHHRTPGRSGRLGGPNRSAPEVLPSCVTSGTPTSPSRGAVELGPPPQEWGAPTGVTECPSTPPSGRGEGREPRPQVGCVLWRWGWGAHGCDPTTVMTWGLGWAGGPGRSGGTSPLREQWPRIRVGWGTAFVCREGLEPQSALVGGLDQLVCLCVHRCT